jgi:DNA adenine methylase
MLEIKEKHLSNSPLCNLNPLKGSHKVSAEISGMPGVTPIFRWAGSKKKLVPQLLVKAPECFNTYYEPFFGSGVLFINLQTTGSVIADVNPHLIQAYNQIKINPLKVWNVLKSISADTEMYYQIRSLDWEKLDHISRAARFMYLNRFCFNGVYRTNRQGGFNVSRGKGNLGVPSWGIFNSFSEKLRNCEIHHSDFERIVLSAKLNDFVYIDPPYIDLEKRDRGEYGPDSFKINDFERLVSSVKKADRAGAKVLISYRDCPRLQSMLPEWHVDHLRVQRTISCKTNKRKKTNEIFISNY